MARHTNEQVAHYWAHRRPVQGGTISTDGTTLYSYNTAIAVWHTAPDGTALAFISSDNMTATTGSKHLNPARRAVSYKYFATPAFHYGHYASPNAAECILAAAEEMSDAFKHLCRQRTRLESGIERYTERRDEILHTAELFNITLDSASIPEATGDLKAKAKEQRALDAERRRQETERRIEGPPGSRRRAV